MSTSFDREVALTLNEAIPLAKARAEATGHPLRAADYSEIARLAREWRGGNAQALEGLRVWIGAPAAKSTAPAVGADADLGRLLLETAGHRSPFFVETGPRAAKEIVESAGTFAPEVAQLATSLPAYQRDEIKNQAVLDLAKTVSFGGRRLDS
jgi:hypothetical protein